ncbi:MAG TPA: hypothetical protein PLE30_08070, partial [Candidatus Kapabacteria bacterium]|nr:hypothetical protein [Candidatus Kapabacteria bacterium]
MISINKTTNEKHSSIISEKNSVNNSYDEDFSEIFSALTINYPNKNTQKHISIQFDNTTQEKKYEVGGNKQDDKIIELSLLSPTEFINGSIKKTSEISENEEGSLLTDVLGKSYKKVDQKTADTLVEMVRNIKSGEKDKQVEFKPTEFINGSIKKTSEISEN